MKKTIITVAATVLLAVFIVFVSYFWPTSDHFRVVNTEVKRIDVAGDRTADQYRITAVRISDDKRMVFRNEDAWFFLKFDSADIQGDASIAEQYGFVAEITYYGWRNNFFSWFWNVTDLEVLRKKPQSK